MPEHSEIGVPVGLICGSGAIPRLVAEGAVQNGRRPIMFCLAGESDPAGFPERETHLLRWGEVGRLFRILSESGCEEVAFVGAISRRPAFGEIRLDGGGALLAPRLFKAMRQGDDGLLRAVATVFDERGVRLVSPLALAPSLTLAEGPVAGPQPGRNQRDDIGAAANAARMAGRLDIGQAAIAISGRVVAVEGAEGTDGLLARVGDMKRSGRVAESGGVLVKVMKPQQDPRLDIPTIGARTVEGAAAAGLEGIGLEAGRCLIADRESTVAALDSRRLFLVGIAPGDAPDNGA